ncbi:MAG TPA: carbohydrate-binding domain-containing protein [Myxococcota bacterium]|nr:carbohydrate-binding domain-containing protein [Myxococcota bacterium]
MERNFICVFFLGCLAAATGCGQDANLSVYDTASDAVQDSALPADADHDLDDAVSDDRIWYIDTTEGDSAGIPDGGTGTDLSIEPDQSVLPDSSEDHDEGTPGDTKVPDCGTDGVTCIFLNHDSISVSGAGAVADGAAVTVVSAGVFLISGTLDDGSITVDTTDSGLVRLLLNGIHASCSTSSPLFIMDAGDVEIHLVAGTTSTLTDAVTYVYADAGQDEPNATIFSKSDLDITGDGTLIVNGRYNDAINVKDGLDILGGTIVASAVDDGIRGKDNVTILGGSVTVTAGNNGIKSDNDTDEGRGFIEVASSHVNVTSGGDALTAQRAISIRGGDIKLVSGGGAGASGSLDVSAKGIKGLESVVISGGNIEIDSADDGVHSDNAILVTGGSCLVASGDDAFHAEETLEITGGSINITRSYEGLESKLITIDDGTIHIVSSDDGINVAGGDGSGGWTPGGGGSSAAYILTINGGLVWMNAGGDGLDSNGNMVINGGTVLVNGPTDNGNGPIDIGDGSGYYFRMNGGLVVAAGSSGMAVGNSTSSTQYGVLVNLTAAQTAGTIFHLRASSGTEMLTFKPAKKYQSVFFSSPSLASGSYDVYLNGTSSGVLNDNLITGGVYTPGTKYTTFSATGVATRVGSSGPPH